MEKPTCRLDGFEFHQVDGGRCAATKKLQLIRVHLRPAALESEEM